MRYLLAISLLLSFSPLSANPALLIATACPNQAAAVGAQCYLAEVMDGDLRLRFPVTILPPLGNKPPREPVVFIPGGPGATSYDDIADVAQYRRLRERRSVVMVDARGSGFADPSLTCTADLESLAECRVAFDMGGLDLDAFSTDRLVDDIESIRLALGIRRWLVWGSSYGSKVALLYGKAHPQATLRLLLELPYPPQGDLFVEEMGHRLDAVAALDRECRRQRSCWRQYGDLKRLYAGAILGAQREPLTIDLAGEPQMLDGVALFSLIAELQFDTRMVPELPAAIAAAARRDSPRMSDIVSRFRTLDNADEEDARGLAVGLNLSIECPEKLATAREAGPEWLQRAQYWPEALLRLAQSARDDYLEACEYWAGESRRAASPAAIQAEPEALVLAMSLDPGSTRSWAQQMAQHARRNRIVVLPGQSHTPRLGAGLSCSDELVADFARNGLVDFEPDCIDDLSSPAFVAP